METLLIHRDISQASLAKAAPEFQKKEVEIRADDAAYSQLSALDYDPLRRAEEKDWSTEYQDTIMSVRVVDDLDAAIEHMEHYGSHPATPSLPKIGRPQSGSSRRWIPQLSTGMLPRASRTEENLALAPRSESAPINFTRADRWDWKN